MKDKKPQSDDFKIDESQFDIDQSEYETTPKEGKKKELPEETEVVPIDERKETIHFPWAIAIIIGVLMVLIIACFIVIKVLEG